MPTLDALDPIRAVESQFKKLAASTRHVSLFLGAGASRACGLPDIAQLRDMILSRIAKTKEVDDLFDGRNLEEVLSRLRRIRSLLDGGKSFEGFTETSARELDRKICAALVEILVAGTPDISSYKRLAIWANHARYRHPVEIFTVNYDLLTEHGLESESVFYFDGFVGTIEGRFRADLVDKIDKTEAIDALPPSCVRLWKLHGSVNWALRDTGASAMSVVRLGIPEPSMAAIYPSDEKYNDSRRMPFIALQDRFRRALAVPESLTIICGYSFGDQHLNEILFDAAALEPRSEIYVLCNNTIPAALSEAALKYKNVVVHGAVAALVGGREHSWVTGADAPGIFEGGKFLLGDFVHLTSALIRDQGGANAP